MKSSQIFYFFQLKERIMKYYEDTFFNSNIENQKINMMDAIYFGDKINACKEKLKSVLLQSGQFYDLLCGNYISLQSIEILALPLLKQKEDLDSNLVELFKINPNDLDLQYLACIYIQILDFQNRKIPQIQKQAIGSLKLVQKQNRLKINQLIQNYLSAKNCVIFSSLLQNTYAINLVSNSFSKIFGVTADLVLGKQLNILIPNAIKKDHNKMIQNFIDQDSMNIIERGERQVFAKDRDGFIFPISLRIKIEMLNEDIGACILIQKINQQKQYVLFDEDGYVTDYSKKLYNDLFQPTIKQVDDDQNIFNMIPSLQDIIQKKQMYTQFCSVLIAQKQQDKKVKSQNIQEHLIQTPYNNQTFYSLNDDVFIIKFKFCQNQTKINVKMNFIEIDNYEKETNQSKKKKIIEELNRQLMYKEIQNNLNKNVFNSIDNFNQVQQYSTDRQTYQNFESNGLVQKNQQQNQKQSIVNKLRSFKFNNQDITESEQNVTTNLEYKEEILTKYFSEQTDTNRFNQRHEVYECQGDSIEQINQNSDTQDITLNRYKNINESKQIGLHKMLQMLNNDNTINFYTIDNNQSNFNLSQQKYSTIINDQNESNPIISGNSKYFFEQGNNNFDISLNQLQQNNNISEQICQQFKFNKNFNEHNAFDLESYQKTNQCTNKSMSIEESSSNKKSKKSREVMENEEQKKEQQNEIASVNSSKYTSVDRIKGKMIKKIQEKIFAKSLQIMVIAGFTASIALIAVTIIVYLQNLNSLDNFVDSFLKIDGAIFCFIDVMKVLAWSNYQVLFGFQDFILDSLDLLNQENIQVSYQLNSIISDYNNNFQQLVLNNNSQKQLNQLQNIPFLIQIYPPYFYYPSLVQSTKIISYYQNLQYTIMQFFYEIIFYIINYQEQQESFIWANIVQFKNSMIDLQLIVENYAQTQFNNMNQQQISVITIVGLLSFFMIFSIIPLNTYIQMKREKMMKLFGTFQPQILDFQIQLIELAIYKIDKTKMITQTNKKAQSSVKSSKKQKSIYIKDLMEQTLQLKLQNKEDAQNKNNNFKQTDLIPKYIQRQQQSRNRSIASFNSLPKFNMIIIILGIISVALLCIQPALNILQFKPFQTESNALLQDRIVLIDIFTLLMENQASHMEQILALAQSQVLSTTYYYTYLKNLTNQNEQTISQLPNLTTNLEIQRHNQNLFENFYKNILNQDVCQIRQNFTQYFNSNVTQVTCESLYNGVLKRGLILSIKRVFQTYDELMEMYVMNDFGQQNDFFTQFQIQNSFINFKLLVQIISESVDAIRLYQNQSLQDYKSDLQQTLLQLFVAQLLIVLVVFLIGWLTLFYSFVDQLQKTQSIFKVFHINVLYENEYIQQYFRQLQLNQKS
ncbi:PAS domain S-box protein (macronuclear) [Tetrahymena thermophila SB210]|uniref:PAS domain S-box protein n=1 Tax=Tetrahymena thermophila (strain SB210) TaxID=312017 RepID=Q22VB7_TETTS|nr:PAS domain S-box protein [Tetrahymena thermophila SB210]EAR89248.3 PAS domain S-box protein [Tetrahymena thermophila SB210]|eukprot:XP_001009493.3 PAS domain S-box protein [Tetrahymena thermophila SB210]